MDIRLETEKHLQILEALATYKYLTVSQMALLGLAGEGTYRSYLNEVLRKLRRRKKPTIGCIMPSPESKMVGYEYVYYLTQKGEQDLILNAGWDKSEIRRPIGANPYRRDYHHRKYFIDTQISLYRWADKNAIHIPLFETYFDYYGNTRKGTLRAKTSIVAESTPLLRIIPDGIFLLRQGGKAIFYALEIHMGNDTKRAIKQIYNHRIGLDNGAVSEHYELKLPHIVLYVFEKKSIMESTMKRIRESQHINQTYYPYFYFTHYNNIKSDFGTWVDCNRNIKYIFK